MEFDWDNSPSTQNNVSRKEIEESFEDPFSIRLMPDFSEGLAGETRFFILGKSVSGQPLFTVFWTDGKRYRVILSRPMTEVEGSFYDRKNSDLGN